jgi:subtilisin family serine protease
VASGKGRNATVVGGYASYSGTSMATPHVTGAAALYKARNPGATASQIKSALYGSATATPSCAGKVSTGGRLNVSGF